MSRVGWRAGIGAAIGAAIGAFDDASAMGRVLSVVFCASLGFSVALSLGQRLPTLRGQGISRKERATARRCARRGVAPDDPHLAAAVLETAAVFGQPLPLERFTFRLFAALAGLFAVVAVLCIAADDAAGAVSATSRGAIAALLVAALTYRRRVLRPRAIQSYDRTLALINTLHP